MLHRTLAFLLFVSGLAAYSQTIFIPDLTLRAALNAAKPNSVDANGQCDTAAWNAQPPLVVSPAIHLLSPGSTMDLEGVQYLKMNELILQNGYDANIAVIWPGYPVNINRLELALVNVALFSGAFQPFPASLAKLQCATCGFGTLPPFYGTSMLFIREDLGGQTLIVPPSVTHLAMYECNLTWLPAMPNVKNLMVHYNPLSGAFLDLPAGLLDLGAINTGITQLPSLPPGLQSLWVSNNSLTALPSLPSTLINLKADRNQITVVPALPMGLTTLDVSHNPIPVLPTMNIALRELNVDSCGVSVLNYPNMLKKLWASDNPITSLPAFSNLTELVSVKNCPLLTCVPPLPNSMLTLLLSGSGVNCLPNIPSGLNTANLGIPAVICDITTGPCPASYPVITGTTFQDWDNNGVFDSFEQVRPNSLVLAQPGDLLTASDMNGNYAMPANIGTFSVTGVPGLYEPITTAPYAVSISQISQSSSAGPIGFFLEPYMLDLVTNVTGNNVRPGFNTAVWVHVNNVGTEGSEATVQLTFDPALSYLGSESTPQSVTGNVVEWTTPFLLPGETWSSRVDLYGPPSLVLGAPVTHSATTTPAGWDQTPADNTAVLNDVVVGSFDPNDKRVTPELLMQQDVTVGTRLDYTIRFQNTGTFPAERVLITDTLPAGLQAASMQFIGSSHSCTWYIKQRVLHVFFNNINLPDSTNDEANSHGYVRFTMKPTSNLLVGDAVENVANIYFDFNEPVITEPAIFYVETSLSAQEHEQLDLRAWPNPASGQLIVEFGNDVPLEALSVLDLQGRVVLQVPVVASERQTVDVTGIAPGVYFLAARTVNGGVSTRFVKQ